MNEWAVIERALRLAAKSAEEEVREATIEECAKIANEWCYAHEAAEAIRALSTGAPKP